MATPKRERTATGYPWMTREIHNAFVKAGDKGICISDMYRILAGKGSKASYGTIYRLFYCLRQMKLIEFVRALPAKMKQSFDKKLYRIVAGKQGAEEWKTYPLIQLYPSARLGAARYVPRTSRGRAKKYAKD